MTVISSKTVFIKVLSGPFHKFRRQLDVNRGRGISNEGTINRKTYTRFFEIDDN